MALEQQTTEFLDLIASDFEGNREAVLERVPIDATVGELVGESAQALQLPFQNFFQAVLRGRELNHSETLDEAGVRNEDKIELVPEVSAGAGR
jgi:molybdopterin converting factor small subunit